MMINLKKSFAGLILTAMVSTGFGQLNTIALAEMQTLTNGLDFAVIDTTYYVSLENLNDTGNNTAIPPYDTVQHNGGVFVLFPWEGRFRTNRINLATAFNDWGGPYVNFQQGDTQVTSGPYDLGSPLDPWGSPYFFFSPLGLLRGDNGQVTVELYADQFDRYTLVSLGADGLKSNDDILYEFGGAVQSYALSSLRGPGVQLISPPEVSPVYQADAGTTVVLRGLNLGASQGTSQVQFSGTAITQILNWTSRDITMVLPEGVGGTGSLTVSNQSSVTNPLPLTIQTAQTSVDTWVNY